jgi:hypothetical protein
MKLHHATGKIGGKIMYNLKWYITNHSHYTEVWYHTTHGTFIACMPFRFNNYGWGIIINHSLSQIPILRGKIKCGEDYGVGYEVGN